MKKRYDVDGPMTYEFSVKEYLEAHERELEKLGKLSGILEEIPDSRIDIERGRLAEAIENVEGHTKVITDHARGLHEDFVAKFLAAVKNDSFSKNNVSKFLVQGWYHTRYTPKFEQMFTQSLISYCKEHGLDLSVLDSGDNKFMKLAELGIDEEEGHELWALQDIAGFGEIRSVSTLKDVLPEAKAIVWAQHDRLSGRIPFIGFLGYSFYLELMIANQSPYLLKAINERLGTKPTDLKFMYFHYIVDQGHAVDNMKLLDVVVRSEEDANEVIDNMNFIHEMYTRMIIKSFTA